MNLSQKVDGTPCSTTYLIPEGTTDHLHTPQRQHSKSNTAEPPTNECMNDPRRFADRFHRSAATIFLRHAKTSRRTRGGSGDAEWPAVNKAKSGAESEEDFWGAVLFTALQPSKSETLGMCFGCFFFAGRGRGRRADGVR